MTFPDSVRVRLQISQAGHDQLPYAGKGSGIDRGDAERLFQLLAAEQVLGERYERNGLGFTNAYVTLGPRAQQVIAGKLDLSMGFTKGGNGKSAASKSATAGGKGKDKQLQLQPSRSRINESYDHDEYGGEYVDELLDEHEGIYDANEAEWCVPRRVCHEDPFEG